MKPRAALKRGLHRDAANVLLALVFLVIAAVLPRFSVDRPVYDYLVAFDITQSMDVEDMEVGGQVRQEVGRRVLQRAPAVGPEHRLVVSVCVDSHAPQPRVHPIMRDRYLNM